MRTKFEAKGTLDIRPNEQHGFPQQRNKMALLETRTGRWPQGEKCKMKDDTGRKRGGRWEGGAPMPLSLYKLGPTIQQWKRRRHADANAMLFNAVTR